MTAALLVWDGAAVFATLTCECGAKTEKDIVVGDVLECGACRRIWRLNRTVSCEPATPSEIAQHRKFHYGEGL